MKGFRKYFGYILIFSYTTLLAGNEPIKPNVNAGLWEFKTEFKLGNTASDQNLITHKRCISTQDMYSHPIKPGIRCVKTKEELIGKKYTYTTRCEFKHGYAFMHGEIFYNGNTMQGIITIQFFNNVKQTKVVTKNSVSGKRIGKCKT